MSSNPKSLTEVAIELERELACHSLMRAKYALKWAIGDIEQAGFVSLALQAVELLQGVEAAMRVLEAKVERGV